MPHAAVAIIGAGPYGLAAAAHLRRLGVDLGTPIPLDHFIEYGDWVQRRVAPDLDRRAVTSVEPRGDVFQLTLDDGDVMRTARVVVAGGIGSLDVTP